LLCEFLKISHQQAMMHLSLLQEEQWWWIKAGLADSPQNV
jgi:hypothetical protein